MFNSKSGELRLDDYSPQAGDSKIPQRNAQNDIKQNAQNDTQQKSQNDMQQKSQNDTREPGQAELQAEKAPNHPDKDSQDADKTSREESQNSAKHLDTLLEITNLSVEFHTDAGVVKAVNELNLRLGRKETLGFVGETGAGKTTTALSIMRLVDCPPGKFTSGKIEFEGNDLMQKTEKEMESIRGNKISMIFQDPMTSLNPIMTVGKQIEEVILLHQKVKDKAELKEKAIEMLKLVGIRPERYPDYPHQFSGGMKQRVVIAMALACNPILLIADEPTTALDVTIQAQVLELMKDLKDKYDTSMILITHDLGVVAEICDYVAVIYAGKVVEYAPIERLYNNPQHPYTKGLFNSIPALDDDADRLTVIAGSPPDPSNLPSGCSFHPRCPYGMKCCKERSPKAIETEAGHFTHCFLFDENLSEEDKKSLRGGEAVSVEPARDELDRDETAGVAAETAGLEAGVLEKSATGVAAKTAAVPVVAAETEAAGVATQTAAPEFEEAASKGGASKRRTAELLAAKFAAGRAAGKSWFKVVKKQDSKERLRAAR